MSTDRDILDLILEHHRWFRDQFVELDKLRADAAGADELGAVWEPLADLLDVHAAAEEEIFYPELLRTGETDPEEETLDAIGDHNEIRDGVQDARSHATGSDEWWAGVGAAREANDEHMAEEEREGLADFRATAPVRLRRSMGERFAEFIAENPTSESVRTSDLDPEEYVAEIEDEIADEHAAAAPDRSARGTLAIGSLKGR
jgi:hypothetical protein